MDVEQAGRAEIAGYVRDLRERPGRHGANVISLTSGIGLSNATLQFRVTVVRLFYEFLVEEKFRDHKVRHDRTAVSTALLVRQRAAVAERTCIVCDADKRIDPAHLIPRSLGGCGDPLCVVPLCRLCPRGHNRH